MAFSQLYKIVCFAHIIHVHKWQSSHQVAFLVCTKQYHVLFQVTLRNSLWTVIFSKAVILTLEDSSTDFDGVIL